MKFYKCELIELTKEEDPIKYAYPDKHHLIKLEDRIGDGKCEECGCDEWMFLPKVGSAVREGGKPYIECLNCGYVTHL